MKLSNEKRQVLKEVQDYTFIAEQELLKSLQLLQQAGIKGLTKKYDSLITSVRKLLDK